MSTQPGELKNYTRIWNPILYALARAKFSQNQYRCVMALIERTYRWEGRKTRTLSYQDWSDATGLPKRSVERTVKQLVAASVILVVEEATFTRGATYQMNKDIREWAPEVLDIDIPDDILAVLEQECGGLRSGAYSTHDRVEGSTQRCVEGSTRGRVLSPPSKPDAEPVSRPPKETLYKETYIKKQTDRDDTDPPSQSVGSLPESESETLTPLQEVCQAYEKHIGILGPSQVDKLRFWLEEPSLSKPVDVITKAIEIASEAGNRRIGYIEGILRNWHNDGVKTLADIERVDGRARGDPGERRTRYDPVAFQKMLEEAGIDATRSG